MSNNLFIFDFDGVFADTKEFYYKIMQQIGPKYGVKEDRAFFDNCLRKDLLTSLQDLALPSEVIVSYLDAVNKHVQQCVHQISFFPFAKEFIIKISQSMPLIIVSHNDNQVILKALQKEGLSAQWILGNDDHPKKTAKLEMVRKKYSNHTFTFIGDTPSDIVAAQEAQMTSIAVSWGYFTKEVLKPYKPDHLFEKPHELEAYISKRLKKA